jgi:hypothetical protein
MYVSRLSFEAWAVQSEGWNTEKINSGKVAAARLTLKIVHIGRSAPSI